MLFLFLAHPSYYCTHESCLLSATPHSPTVLLSFAPKQASSKFRVPLKTPPFIQHTWSPVDFLALSMSPSASAALFCSIPYTATHPSRARFSASVFLGCGCSLGPRFRYCVLYARVRLQRELPVLYVLRARISSLQPRLPTGKPRASTKAGCPAGSVSSAPSHSCATTRAGVGRAALSWLRGWNWPGSCMFRHACQRINWWSKAPQEREQTTPPKGSHCSPEPFCLYSSFVQQN